MKIIEGIVKGTIYEGANEVELGKVFPGIFYEYEPIGVCRDGVTRHGSIEFHESKAVIKGLFGGNSSSKSCTSFHEDVINACLARHPYSGVEIKQPNLGRISVPDFGVLEKLVFSTMPGEPSLRNLIPKSYLQKGSWDKSYDKVYKILRLTNGTQIDFTSYDQDVEKYESVTLDWHHASEEMPEDMFSATMGRLLRTGGKFWMDVTPLKGLAWAEREIWEKRGNGLVDAWFLDLLDNPYISEEKKKQFIASLPEEQRESRIHGHFPTWAGKIYDRLNEGVHRINDIPVVGNRLIYPDGTSVPVFVLMSIDPHDRTPTAVSWYALLPNNDIYAIKEGWLKEMDIKQICNWIKDVEQINGWRVNYRIADPNKLAQRNNLRSLGWTLEDDFRQNGIRFRGRVDDGLEIGHSKVREYINFDKTKPIDLTNRPKFYIYKSCIEHWYQLTHYQRDEWHVGKDGKDPKEKPQEKHKHFPDVDRYMIVSKPSFDKMRELATPDYANQEQKAVGWYA